MSTQLSSENKAGSQIPNITKIRAFLKRELESLYVTNRGPFSQDEIENELNRRAEINRNGPYHS